MLTLVRNISYTFNYHNKDHNFALSTHTLGGTVSGVLTDSSAVVRTWKFLDGTTWEGAVLYNELEPYAGTTYAEDTSERIYLDKLVFTPNSTHADTVYMQCTQHENEGAEITISDTEGSIVNNIELYHLLCAHHSNRVEYANTPNSDLIEYFLTNFIPAGSKPKIINAAPSGTITGDVTSWYDPAGADISLSGLLSDLENDILIKTWEQTAPTIALLTSSSLLSPISSSTTLGMSADLTDPPVDTIYDFRLSIDDTYNTTRVIAEIKVSGVTAFDTWDHDDFAIGDCRLPFTLLP